MKVGCRCAHTISIAIPPQLSSGATTPSNAFGVTIPRGESLEEEPGSAPVASFAPFAIRHVDCEERTVSRTMSDMKQLTMRDLSRKTARVLDALERGETFEVRRHGRAIGYLTKTPPHQERKPDWKAHFDWLRGQPPSKDSDLLTEFEDSRAHLRAREKSLENSR